MFFSWVPRQDCNFLMLCVCGPIIWSLRCSPQNPPQKPSQPPRPPAAPTTVLVEKMVSPVVESLVSIKHLLFFLLLFFFSFLFTHPSSPFVPGLCVCVRACMLCVFVW